MEIVKIADVRRIMISKYNRLQNSQQNLRILEVGKFSGGGWVSSAVWSRLCPINFPHNYDGRAAGGSLIDNDTHVEP